VDGGVSARLCYIRQLEHDAPFRNFQDVRIAIASQESRKTDTPRYHADLPVVAAFSQRSGDAVLFEITNGTTAPVTVRVWLSEASGALLPIGHRHGQIVQPGERYKEGIVLEPDDDADANLRRHYGLPLYSFLAMVGAAPTERGLFGISEEERQRSKPTRSVLSIPFLLK